MNRIIDEIKKADINNELKYFGSFECKRGTTGRDCYFVVVTPTFFSNKSENDLWDKIDEIEVTMNLSITIVTEIPENTVILSEF